MKKICFSVLCAFSAIIVTAQSLDDINDMMVKSQFAQAKTAIDKILAQPKNQDKSDNWYYKGRIYNSYSYEKTVPDSMLYSLRSDAFDAFKKNQQLDPNDIRLKLETWDSYLNLYGGFYDLGAKQFNAKNYEAAYQSFKKALEVKDYILNKKYVFTQASLHPLDTALVLNTAVAAVQAKKIDEGIGWYRKLIDANVAGKDYQEVYEYVVDYYSKKGDNASLKPVLDKAKTLYPADDFWNDVELRGVSKTDQAGLFAKYDEMIAKDPSNFRIAYNYGVELYNSIYGKDAKTTAPDDLTAKNKLTAVLKVAIANEKEAEATVLMSNHLFNMAADLLNAANMIKSPKPEDVKKKSDLKALSNKTMDDCITYSESAAKFFESQPALKTMQKANYKIVLGYLNDIYNLKNNPKKAAEYEAKSKAIDKKP